MSGSNALLDAIANPKQVNVLGAYQGANEVARGMWANRAMQAKQAIGQNVLAATNPDGTIDTGKLGLLNSQNPMTALGAQQSATDNQALSRAQQDQGGAAQGLISSAISSALAIPKPAPGQPDPIHEAVAQNMQRLVDAGAIPRDRANLILTRLPNDPTALRAQLEQTRLSMLPPDQQQAQIYGTRPQVNTGGNIQFPNVPPASSSAPAPVIPTTTTPAEKIAPVIGPAGARGQPTTIPSSDYARSHGLDPNTGNPISPLGSGRLPTGLLNPANQPQAASPTATGLGPAQQAAEGASGTQSAGAFQSYAADSNKAVQQNTILGNMLADSKDFTTGPLNSRIRAFQSFATTYAPKSAGAFGLESKTVAASQSFDKLAAQLADAQGAGSDARLSVNQAANPHGEMAPASVDLVIRQLQGNADYTRAKGTLAAAYPDKADREGFDAAVNKNLDPRAFQFSRMTVPQRQTYAAALSKEDFTAVQGAYNWAVTHGLIGAANAPQ
jgi:hypothetical protein